MNNSYGNKNDLSGYSVSELVILPVYGSIKEEATQNILHPLTMNQFKATYQKSLYYKEATKTKKLKSDDGYGCLHYGIANKSPIFGDHILSCLLYTNYSDFSRVLSCSFRPIYKWEDVEDIKARNSQFYYISKSLRECVELFGGSAAIT